MKDALDKADHFLQQAEDALTPSSIAILVLPLALNLIPVALLAEVSTVTMVIYSIFSDFLSCVPLLIKGVELISIQKNPNRAFTVRLTSASNGTRADSAGSEIWAADCRAPKHIGDVGTIFVILSIIFMVAGFAPEILAKWYLQHRRAKYRRKGTDVVLASGKDSSEEATDSLIAGAWSADDLEIFSFSAALKEQGEQNNI